MTSHSLPFPFLASSSPFGREGILLPGIHLVKISQQPGLSPPFSPTQQWCPKEEEIAAGLDRLLSMRVTAAQQPKKDPFIHFYFSTKKKTITAVSPPLYPTLMSTHVMVASHILYCILFTSHATARVCYYTYVTNI